MHPSGEKSTVASAECCDRAYFKSLLSEAEERNPGRWVDHSRNVAKAAEVIAAAAGMDAKLAWSLGLLHDVGRRVGIVKIRHSLEGYDYLKSLDLEKHARICLTHSYYFKSVEMFGDQNDYSDAELERVNHLLQSWDYDDYDRLIQLCDYLGLPDRLCRVEERIEDILSRHQPEHELHRRAIGSRPELKIYFDRLCGEDVYSLLGV